MSKSKRLSIYSHPKCGLISVFSYHPLEYCFEIWNEYDHTQSEITWLHLVTKEEFVTILNKYSEHVHKEKLPHNSYESIYSRLKNILEQYDFNKNIIYPIKNLIKSINNVVVSDLFKIKVGIYKTNYQTLNETGKYKPIYIYTNETYGTLIDPHYKSLEEGLQKWNKIDPELFDIQSRGLVTSLRRTWRRELLEFIRNYNRNHKFYKPIHIWKSCFSEHYDFEDYLKLSLDEIIYYILELEYNNLLKPGSLCTLSCFN